MSVPERAMESRVTNVGAISWLVAGAALILLMAAFGMQHPLAIIHESWSGKYGHFAHGYAVLGFAIWLGVRAWRTRGVLTLKPQWPALPVLLLLVALLIICVERDIRTGIKSLVPAILFSALVVAFGIGLGRLFVWAVACIYFAMPIWYVALNEPLRQLTTAVSVGIVRLSGIPVYVRGSEFELATGIVEIAGGCSGLNYLVSALSLAYLFGMLYLREWTSRLQLLAVAALAALVMNWVRVVSLIFVAHASDMRHYLIRHDHLYYGWVLFLLVLVPIFWLGARLERGGGTSMQLRPSAQSPSLSLQPIGVMIASAVASICLLAPLLFSNFLPAR